MLDSPNLVVTPSWMDGRNIITLENWVSKRHQHSDSSSYRSSEGSEVEFLGWVVRGHLDGQSHVVARIAYLIKDTKASALGTSQRRSAPRASPSDLIHSIERLRLLRSTWSLDAHQACRREILLRRNIPYADYNLQQHRFPHSSLQLFQHYRPLAVGRLEFIRPLCAIVRPDPLMAGAR